MRAVSVFDLTDEDLDAAAAVRRANPLPPRPDDAYWLAVIARRQRERREVEARAIASARRCDRCGIDTAGRDLCLDCLDVLALETA